MKKTISCGKEGLENYDLPLDEFICDKCKEKQFVKIHTYPKNWVYLNNVFLQSKNYYIKNENLHFCSIECMLEYLKEQSILESDTAKCSECNKETTDLFVAVNSKYQEKYNDNTKYFLCEDCYNDIE